MFLRWVLRHFFPLPLFTTLHLAASNWMWYLFAIIEGKHVRVKSDLIKFDLFAKKKQNKYRLWERYTETEDGKVFTEYRWCSNQLRWLTLKTVKLYESNISKQAKSNHKAFWRYVGSKTIMKSKYPICILLKRTTQNVSLRMTGVRLTGYGISSQVSLLLSRVGDGIYQTSLGLDINFNCY